jgi:hypothetical protein
VHAQIQFINGVKKLRVKPRPQRSEPLEEALSWNERPQGAKSSWREDARYSAIMSARYSTQTRDGGGVYAPRPRLVDREQRVGTENAAMIMARIGARFGLEGFIEDI